MENKNQSIEEIESGIGLIDFSQYQEDVEKEDPVVDTDKLEDEDQVIENTEEVESEKEEVEEVEKGEEEEKVEDKQEPAVSDLSNLAKRLVDSGYWNDFVIETEDGEITLSEIEDLDEEKFLEIQKAQEEERSKREEGSYISRDDLDEYTQQIFDVAKEGGNVTKLLEIKKNILDPLEGYDLDNEAHQEALVRNMYAVENGITDPNKINKLIAGHKEDLDLDVTAKEFSERLRSYYNTVSEKEKQDAIDKKKEEKQKEVKLKEDLKNSFKSIGVKKMEAVKPLIDKATKRLKEGGVYEVSKDFEDIRNDPQEFAEYLLWRYNREDYNKMISSLESKDTVKKNLTRLSFVRNTTKPQSKDYSDRKKNKAADFMKSGFDLKQKQSQ